LERERAELLSKARKVAGGSGGGGGSDPARSGFFDTPLELRYEGALRHCDEE
jgi:hypothetical protein